MYTERGETQKERSMTKKVKIEEGVKAEKKKGETVKTNMRESFHDIRFTLAFFSVSFASEL